jgi:hypothetical protein
MMRLTIRQSWLRVQVNSMNESGRTLSHSVNAFPELQEDRPLIWSVYRGEVEAYSPTEGPTHNGGALLHVAQGGARIFGTYFSDRGIAHHKPSSGRFELWRFSDDPDREELERNAVADFLKNHPFQAD